MGKKERKNIVTASVHYPNSEEGRRFCEFFNHRFSFIVAPLNGSGKPEWKTIAAYPIEHRNLWNRFLDPDTLVGLSFGPTTHYGVLQRFVKISAISSKTLTLTKFQLR
jgi:hypothetical protein